MTSIKKTISVLIISTLTINCSFAQWSEDANNIWGTDSRKAIGIGTATPKAKLEVMGEIKGYTQLHVGENYDAINGRGITVDNGGSTSWELLTLRNNFGTHFKVDGDGRVGIGTNAPKEKLDVIGGIRSVINSNEGGYISLSNPSKTDPAAAATWNIYNMTGGYGNSLQFWGYSSTETLGPKLIIADNGNITFKGLIRIPMASAIDNQSPGITPWPGDDFKYNGEYLNHYGLGFHLYEFDNGSTKGTNAYLSGYYGVNFFTGGCNRLRINYDGNVGIGTTTPTEKLSVNGNIKAKKLIVTQTGWADYVFDKAYTLMPVDSLSTYIKTHKHLPEMPTTKDVQNNGVDVGNNQALLLKKIEELTLYIIEQHKEIEALKKKIK
ncbi:MAG TPA: hypothetical protein PK772_08160 [Chitinophagaceae bacterium]|nr:hypothetical protein [Chitinophagaceae bacterium]